MHDDKSNNVHCLSSKNDVCLRILPVYVCANNRSVQNYALRDHFLQVRLRGSSLGLTGKPAAFSITAVNRTSAPKVGKQVSFIVTFLDADEFVLLDKVWPVDG